jgi:hypothetical protein
MKKLTILLLFLLIINQAVIAQFVMTQFAGGNGTKKFPFLIETPEHLNNVRYYMEESYYFSLNNDINLALFLKKGEGWNMWGASGWLPIGNYTDTFEGNFQGNGNSIEGLWIVRPDHDYVGLFGVIGVNGLIESLHVKIESSSNITGHNNIGGICGKLRGSISSCSVKGSIIGEWGVGGMAGIVSQTGNIENSFTEGEISCGAYSGGFVGYIYLNTTIQNCFSHTNVTQTFESDYAGSFVCRLSQSSIVNCYSTGWVKEGSTVQTNKGFAGVIDTGAGCEITGCFWDTETSGASSSAGEATGKTTAEMTTGAHTYPNFYTLENWDFKDACNENIWNIGNGRNSGYPYLNWQYPNDPPFALFAGGNGSESDPFQITCAQHLDNVRNFLGNSNSDKHFILMNDIDLTAYLTEGGAGYSQWGTAGWSPIGNFLDRFEGIFYGEGKKITGLWINRPDSNYVALCGVLGEEGTIMELGVEVNEAHSISGNNFTSIFTAKNYGNISNCFSKGVVEGNNYVGNFVGYNWETITKCFSTGEVYGETHYIGGFVGINYYGFVENCFSTANVTTTINPVSNNDNGAFNGKNYRGKINNCYSTGWVKYNTTILTDRGFCGSIDTTRTSYEMSGNFWDIETSGATSTAGSATGLTTAQMKQEESFINWNFTNNWSIVDSFGYVSYPFLTYNPQNPAPGLEHLFAGGNGSESDPFQITCAQHLDNVRNFLGTSHSDKHFILMNDIDLTAYLTEGGAGYSQWGTAGWLHIGKSVDRFEGIFYGESNKITGLWINRPDSDYGSLWGVLGEEGTIMELGVEVDEAYSISGKNGTSIFIADNWGNISNCFSKGVVEGNTYVGNFVGANGGTITECFSTGEVYGENNHVGGFAGRNSYGTIENCFSTANVVTTADPVDYFAGAFNGTNFQGKINNCYSIGWVKYNTAILKDRGFCGDVDTGTSYEMTCNFWDIETSGAILTAGSATGLTTAQMQDPDNFTDVKWDFKGETINGTNEIWNIGNSRNNDYPYLSWQYPDDPGLVPVNLSINNLSLSSSESDCFNALNTITVAGDEPGVVFESGSMATIIAGNSIQFLPGFHALNGSYMHAYITDDNTFCDGMTAVAAIVAVPVEKSISVDSIKFNKNISVLPFMKVYPNPNNGRFSILLDNYDRKIKLCVMNMLGEIVNQPQRITSERYEVDLSQNQKGIYLVRLNDGEHIICQKIMIK